MFQENGLELRRSFTFGHDDREQPVVIRRALRNLRSVVSVRQLVRTNATKEMRK